MNQDKGFIRSDEDGRSPVCVICLMIIDRDERPKSEFCSDECEEEAAIIYLHRPKQPSVED